MSILSIDYALNAFSATILARRARGRIAAYFGDLAGLACLLGSTRKKHGWLSCVGHFCWIIQLLLDGGASVRETPFERWEDLRL